MTVGDLRERLFDIPDGVELMYNKDGTFIPLKLDVDLWPVMHKGMTNTLTAVALVFETAPGDAYYKDGTKLR